MLERSRICKDISEFSRARVVTFLNPYSFIKIAESDVSLENFDKICIDGIALKLFLERVYRGAKIERLSFDFTSVAHHVFQQAAARGERGFILGSDENSNSVFLQRISDMFPGICLEGRAGYFKDDAELSAQLQSLLRTAPDYVVIGMGAVKQEQVTNNLFDLGFRGRIYTCGGFIHQTAMGDGIYYPAWVDRLNLRFAYRMYKEPSTIKRYLIDYPRSFALMLRNIRQFNR